MTFAFVLGWACSDPIEPAYQDYQAPAPIPDPTPEEPDPGVTRPDRPSIATNDLPQGELPTAPEVNPAPVALPTEPLTPVEQPPAPVTPPPEPTSPPPHKVYLIGDSLMVGATNAAKAALEQEYELTIHAKVGDSVSKRMPYIEEAAREGAEAVIIQLGINDVGGGCPVAESTMHSRIGQALDTVAAARCVFWVNSQERYVTGPYAAKLNCSAPVLNRIIAEEVEKRDNAELVDFRATMDADPGSLNSGDGLHLNSAGMQAAAEAYRNALASCR